MSSPPHYKPAQWRPDRLRIACHARGIASPAAFYRALNRHRSDRDASAPPLDRSTCSRLLRGETDPSRGRQGYTPLVFEIADALGLSVDWLMGRVSAEPSISDRAMRLARAAEAAGEAIR